MRWVVFQKDVSSSFLSIIKDVFIHRSTSSPLPIRSFCIKTIKGTDESSLHHIFQTFQKPQLVSFHLLRTFGYSICVLDVSSHLESVNSPMGFVCNVNCTVSFLFPFYPFNSSPFRTVCLRSDVFASLPSNLRIRPFGGEWDPLMEITVVDWRYDWWDETRDERISGRRWDYHPSNWGSTYSILFLTYRLIQESNKSCEHKHLFQLNRMGMDHSLYRLCSSIDSDGKP